MSNALLDITVRKNPNISFGTVVVTSIDNPFDIEGSKKTRTDLHGSALFKYLPAFCLGQEYHVAVNGKIQEDLDYIVQSGDNIHYLPIVKGGDDNKVLRMVLMVVLIIVANVYGAQLGEAMGLTGAIASAVGTAVIMVAGSLLINAILPPTMPDANISDPSKESNNYSWTGTSTNRNLNVPIPVLYGTFALGGTVINNKFYYQDSDDWVGTQLALCHGEIEEIAPEGITINDADYSSFIDDDSVVDGFYKVAPGTFGQAIMTGFEDTSFNNIAVADVLLANVPYIFTTQSNNIDLFKLHIIADRGVFSMSREGTLSENTVTFNVEYRKVGDTPWIPLSVKNSGYVLEYEHKFPAPHVHTIWSDDIVSFSIGNDLTTGLPINSEWNGNTRKVSANPEEFTTSLTITDKTRNSIKKFYEPVDSNNNSLVLPQGQYEIRVTRLTPDDEEGDNYNSTQIGVRFIEEINTTDVNYGGLAMIGFNLKATQQISGARPNYKVTATRKPLFLNGEYRDCTNPAWICYDILTNQNYGMKVDTTAINTAEFEEWASFCEAGEEQSSTAISKTTLDPYEIFYGKLKVDQVDLPDTNQYLSLDTINYATSYINIVNEGRTLTIANLNHLDFLRYGAENFYRLGFSEELTDVTSLEYYIEFWDGSYINTPKLSYNGVLDTLTDVWSTLQDIATVGRGQIILQGTKYSVIYDTKKEVTGLYNASNSTNHVVNYISQEDIATEVEVAFSDKNLGYEMNQVVIQDVSAYEAGAKAKISSQTVKGITSEEEALTHGRYLLAASKALRRILTFDADIEAITQTVGELVAVQTDVSQYGIGGIILDKVGNTLTLDTQIDILHGTNYTLKIKNKDTDAITDYPVTIDETVIGTYEVTVVNATNINIEDRYSFGVVNSDSFLGTITEISRDGELTRTMTVMEYNESVLDFNYDNDLVRHTQPVPKVKNSISNFVIDDRLIKLANGTITTAVNMTWDSVIPSSYNVYIANEGDTIGNFKNYVGSGVFGSSFEFTSSIIVSGNTYDFYIEDASDVGIVTKTTYKVLGFTAPPPDVDLFTIKGLPTESKVLSFDITINKPFDLAGYIIKYHFGKNSNWNTGTQLHQGILGASPFSTDVLNMEGEYTVMIKAIDTSNNESVNASLIYYNQFGNIVDNLIYEKDFHGEGFPGIITGGSIVPPDSNLLADLSVDNFYFKLDLDEMYPLNNTEKFYQGTFSPMVYQGSFFPDGSGLALITYTGFGTPIIEYRQRFPNPMYTGDALNMWLLEDEDIMWQEAGWTLYSGGFDVIHDLGYDIRVTFPESNLRSEIATLTVIVDVEDVDENFDDITVPSGGIIISPTYINRIKNVLATLQTSPGSSATRVETEDKTDTTATLRCYDVNDVAVAGLIDVRFKGYINN